MACATTETVAAKAARLRAEDKVRQVPGLLYEVEGDHGTYLVAIADPDDTTARNINCSCPATGVCSHAVAATAMSLAAPHNRKDSSQ